MQLLEYNPDADLHWSRVPKSGYTFLSGPILIGTCANTSRFNLIGPDDRSHNLILQPGRYVLVAGSGRMRIKPLSAPSVSSGLLFSDTCRTILPMLLACLDESNHQPTNARTIGTRVAPPLYVIPDNTLGRTRKNFEQYIIAQHITATAEWIAFCDHIRALETYGIARFLLCESVDRDVRLEKLAKRYGLSPSHFRRLCRTTLGQGAKHQLRNWRLARSLLDMVDRSAPLTTVALNNGYASSSHFSSEVRSMLGVKPSELTTLPEGADTQ
ncbi:helix-turn-helix domain-containing protein [Burkholderia cepacia]|uniref:helix-turn-helix domain-containing protein n=1 Tax=Burkholderia cepacia TaxID=292 RepID=UPI0009B9F3E5|nr:helix-turn-helix domain-containing protein [Burkholderia cepacia]